MRRTKHGNCRSEPLTPLVQELQSKGRPRLAAFAQEMLTCLKERVRAKRLSPSAFNAGLCSTAVLLRYFDQKGLDLSPQQLDAGHWHGFRDWLQDTRKTGPSGYNCYVLPMRILARFSDGEGRPIPHWRTFLQQAEVAKPKVHIFSHHEIQGLLDRLLASQSKLAADLALFVLCSAQTGLRTMEIAALKPTDLRELGQWKAIFIRGKAESERIVPLSPDLERLLRARASSIAAGGLFFARIVFFNDRTRHFALKTTAKMLLKRHCDKPFGALAGRHFFASHCAKNGIKIDQLQLLLGHAAVKNTARYLDLRDQEVLTSFNSIQPPTE